MAETYNMHEKWTKNRIPQSLIEDTTSDTQMYVYGVTISEWIFTETVYNCDSQDTE
jgi:hypothetical protein